MERLNIEDMDYELLEDKKRIAIRAHSCACCGKELTFGHWFRIRSEIYNGKPDTYYLCPEAPSCMGTM